MKSLLTFVVVFPLLAAAQAEPAEEKPEAPEIPAEPSVPPPEPAKPAPPVALPAQAEPVHAAVPIPKNWNIGAGITFTVGTLGFNSGTGSALPGLAGSSGVAQQPRMTLLIERRLNDHLFFNFQAAVIYGANQTETGEAPSFYNLVVEGTVGLRRIFNPGGVIEVSFYGNAGAGYVTSENKSIVSATDEAGASVQTPQTLRSYSYAFGVIGGLTLERELIAGLALRLSSSIIGISYGRSSITTFLQGTRNEIFGSPVDAGLRFSPAIELRYAF